MHFNNGLAGPNRLEQFNVRQCSLVLGVYGVITIISYFNELAQSGLLYGHSYRYPEYASNSFMGGHNSLIERVGGRINLDVSHLKEILQTNTSRSSRSSGKESQINIAVHLGKNASYERSVNNSGVQVISYQNVMPNFFAMVLPWSGITTSLPVNVSKDCGELDPSKASDLSQNNSFIAEGVKCPVLPFNGRPLNLSSEYNVTGERQDVNTTLLAHAKTKYSSATKVLLYQQEMGGYAMRDCFKTVTKKAGLDILSVPLNQAFRQEWEFVPEVKKSKFQALYGSLSFGVCENIKRPCLYMTMMTHPLDRILQVYFQCRQNVSQNLCSFYRSSNITQGDILTFIKATGNSYFRKLIYHSKQCRLIGEDEICIQDGKASFILSREEREANLQNILQNLDSWFAVIGLIDHYKESVKLFEFALGEKFTECPTYNSVFHQKDTHVHMNSVNSTKGPLTGKNPNQKAAKTVLKSDITALRTKLLDDPRVVQWLFADLAIYEKAKSLFNKQWIAFQELKHRSNVSQKYADVTNKSINSVVNKTSTKRKPSNVLLLEKTKLMNNITKRSVNDILTRPYNIKKALRASRKHKKKVNGTSHVTEMSLNEPMKTSPSNSRTSSFTKPALESQNLDTVTNSKNRTLGNVLEHKTKLNSGVVVHLKRTLNNVLKNKRKNRDKNNKIKHNRELRVKNPTLT